MTFGCICGKEFPSKEEYLKHLGTKEGQEELDAQAWIIMQTRALTHQNYRPEHLPTPSELVP